jgi:hypothetical protein
VLTTAVSAAPAVTAKHVLQDFFAALVLEVDVDVRRLVALLGHEALEQQRGAIGSISVMPKAKHTAELAAEPRP